MTDHIHTTSSNINNQFVRFFSSLFLQMYLSVDELLNTILRSLFPKAFDNFPINSTAGPPNILQVGKCKKFTSLAQPLQWWQLLGYTAKSHFDTDVNRNSESNFVVQKMTKFRWGKSNENKSTYSYILIYTLSPRTAYSSSTFLLGMYHITNTSTKNDCQHNTAWVMKHAYWALHEGCQIL